MEKENQKREEIEAYFDGSGNCLGGIGILLLIIGGACSYWGSGKIAYCGYGAIALGILCIVCGYCFFGKNEISDEKMDKYINEDLQQIEAKAIKLLDFEEESLLTTPVFLTSTPDLLDAIWSGSDRKLKIGEDQIIRYSPINVTILYPTKNMLACYMATWDLLTGKALNENTDEYFYNDITSVSMKSESKQLTKSEIEKLSKDNEIISKIRNELLKRAKKLPNEFDKLTISGEQQISIATSGGNKLNIHLKNSEVEEIAGFKSRDTAEMEKGIQTLRKLIRDKKSA